MDKQVHLAAFVNPSHMSHSHASWRHPRSRNDFLSPKLWQDIGRTLERGLFDLLFVGDSLSIPTRFGGGVDRAVERGTQAAVMMDPMVILSVVSAATERLGLAATASTTYFNPFDVARRFSTLDHMSQGRSGWNIVTSIGEGDAKNFGVDEHLPHDVRYDRAEEFVEVVHKLWGSWDKDALVVDKDSGQFARPGSVRPIDHSGQWFSVRGPLNVPHSPQSRPVLMQAGSSGRGRDFAGRWAEAVFAVDPTPEGRKSFYKDIKDRAETFERGRGDVKVLQAFMPFVAETDSMANEIYAYHNELVDPADGLVVLSNQMDHDFSQYDLDQPLVDVDVEGQQGMFAVLQRLSKRDNLTLRDVGRMYAESGLVPPLIGSPASVADMVEEMIDGEETDGLMLIAGHSPGTFTDFVDLVVPELQKRGRFRKEYAGPTLRSHLGLGEPTLHLPPTRG
ncbi:LLM class flavin-dependent oxidoreductase [Aeromicrobium sp. Leaf350]|uniref:LLM class flavin-dependent oxidoreductase n=1 Tax=Aeromicrobium sp. Leaf350 TaxID=2876565 RepID=UPI001E646B55|nr:LLM class flavin-dependent oxidoreductase [Aeromicrobium sp. Leaf350]